MRELLLVVESREGGLGKSVCRRGVREERVDWRMSGSFLKIVYTMRWV